MTTVTFLFTGRLAPASFAAFARHRAARLALDVGATDVSADGIRITVTGAGDLVDAFEMACSLGPRDCLIADVIRDDGEDSAP